MNQAEVLLNRVAADGDGEAAYELLQEFFNGFPVIHLRRLLHSEDPTVACAGSFIASELGRTACTLVEDFEELLGHGVARVRYDILDSVLLCATEKHGPLI